MTRAARLWLTAAVLAVVAAVVAGAGLRGLGYAIIYGVAVLPGVWMGRALFGRDQIAGWFAGAAIGYGATQLALWLPIFVGVPSAVSLLLCWLVLASTFVGIARRNRDPIVDLPPNTVADARALALVLMLVPLIMAPVYRNLGRADESGTRYYRAYFTADFVWHTALASELGKYSRPPRNPYMATSELHYYWGYFLLPAVVAREAPSVADVQTALKANAICSAAIVLGLLLFFTRAAVVRPGLAAGAVVLVVLASSAEGTFVLEKLWRAGRPISSVTDLNIDAVTAWKAVTGWRSEGLRIDDLPRGFWYNPQHTLACGLGLLAALIAATCGALAQRSAILLAGVSLGLATCFNPFIGGLFSIIYAAGVTTDALRRGLWRAILQHALAAIPVGAALGWCVLNGVTEGAGSAVTFGFKGFARNNTIAALLLSTGPVLLPAIPGMLPLRRLPGLPAIVAGFGAVLALVLMHTLTLSEASWVGFRTGQILLLMLPALIARTLYAVRKRSRILVMVVAAAILVAGAPTTVIDAYNAQDIGNRRMGPGFPWTLTVTPAQLAAFRWVQNSLPADAVVQMEPILRGRAHWSLIPTFAERRMIAGLPISLLPTPEYQERSARVQRVFQTADAREASQLARELGIGYLYVDPDDRAAYPEGVAKLDGQPAFFEKAYDAGGVSLYRVR